MFLSSISNSLETNSLPYQTYSILGDVKNLFFTCKRALRNYAI